MNYAAWTGYWFYNAATAISRANLFSSYGLLADAPAPSAPSGLGQRVWNWFWEFFN